MILPRAFRDEVLVKLIYKESIDNGKFLIPETGSEHKYHSDFYGEVVSIGPDYPYELSIGDKVMFQRHEGRPIRVGDDDYLLLRERWVMGVFV